MLMMKRLEGKVDGHHHLLLVFFYSPSTSVVAAEATPRRRVRRLRISSLLYHSGSSLRERLQASRSRKVLFKWFSKLNMRTMSCAAALLEVLHSTPRLACLPGGRDRQGRPLLLVAAPEPANSSSVCNASSSSASFSSTHSTPPPSHGDVHELQATRDHCSCTETRRGGLAVLVDGQQASGRQVRASVRLVELTLRSDVAALLVLRPDAFWDKQRVDCTRSAHVEGQPLYIPLSRLHKYVDQGQLPPELGGSWVYDHARWVDNRLAIGGENNGSPRTLCLQFVESFSRDAEGVVSDLEKVRHRLTALAPGVRASSVEPALALSRDMFSATTDVTSKEEKRAEVLLQYETSYLASLPRGLKEHQLPQDLLDTKSKVSRTLEIVRGKQSLIAQAWGALEQGCRASRELGVLEAGVARVTDWLLGVAERLLDAQQAETYGQYAELLHKIDTLPQQSNIEVPSDLKCQRDFMDFVCRSFASRLERRRNVLITSLRFYRLVSEYFERTSNLFELLGASAEDTESCEAPEAMMRSLDEDHASIAARRHVFCGAVQLHRLRLQQTAHVRAYEEDATQAVQWLQDLYQVMLKEHAYVGCSVMEIQTQKDAHQTFQDTAKHCRQLQELRDAVTTLARMQRRRSGDVEDCRVRVRNLLTSREALLLEVGRMVRLGRLLRSRLREPLCPDLASGTESAGASNEDEHMNAAAVEAISERLAEVTALAEALDAALGAARHEPGPAASPSATSTHPPNDVADAELQSPPELLAASDEMAAPATEATEPTTTQQQEWYAHSGSSGDEAKTVETLVEDDDEDEFVTVSECTCTPPSGASYHTAQSEPSWWRPDDAAAALVSDPASTRPASTASELDGYSDTEFPPPPPKSPDIATTEFRQEIQAYRETVEVMTTRLRVSHSEPLGLTSYLLTSETTRECMPPTPPDSDQGSSSTAEGTPPLIQQMKEVLNVSLYAMTSLVPYCDGHTIPCSRDNRKPSLAALYKDFFTDGNVGAGATGVSVQAATPRRSLAGVGVSPEPGSPAADWIPPRRLCQPRVEEHGRT
ncbi:hypothetical protein B566_EDAN004272 [Ephemera danica]|nr:hypothetical protein B566_EDAN004272 [Ephemera danica]